MTKVSVTDPVNGRGFNPRKMLAICDQNRFVKHTGSVAFIRTLLVIAGVEQNPGPSVKFVFRYQYLLIEVGTQLLRTLFDKTVGNDFMGHLRRNPGLNKQLKYLVNNNIVTDEQKKYLPPIDNTPTTSNFDISLIACLLRNVCGLRDRKDQVWINPASGDFSVEADIARLRGCRNNLQHRGSVFISETEFTDKWNELCDILNRLNTVCGMTQLSSLIDDAENKDIDEQLQKRHKEAIKAWDEMSHKFECDIKDIKDDVSQLNKRVHDIETRELECQQRKLDNETDIKEILKKNYLENCRTLQVSPTCGNDESCVDLLTFYKPPTMRYVPYHRCQQHEGSYPILSYQEIFSKEDRTFKNVYITGDAGDGKTSFCKLMSFLWCKSQSDTEEDNGHLQGDIDFMATFEFLFYVTLRDADHENVVDIIVDQYFYTASRDIWEETVKTIENILKHNECLIILDGLDEWSPSNNGQKCVLPRRIPSEKCTYLTLCRPYKIEKARLSQKDIDYHIQMMGLHGSAMTQYIREIVQHINNENKQNKSSDLFIKEAKNCGIYDQLYVPMIASHLIMVWFDTKLTDMSRALLYSNIVNMLFKKAEEQIKALPLPEMCKVQPPEFLGQLFYFGKYFSLLEKICFLSFTLLFDQDKSASKLVFSQEQLMLAPYCISVKEMDFWCKAGILSKSKVIGRFGKQDKKLSYIHKSYLEYFAALYVCSFDSNNSFANIISKWTTVNDVVQFQNFFVFLAGFSPHKVKCLVDDINMRISNDLSLCRRNAIFHYDDSESCSRQIRSLQTLVVYCFKEIGKYGDINIVNKIKYTKLDDFIFDDDDDDDDNDEKDEEEEDNGSDVGNDNYDRDEEDRVKDTSDDTDSAYACKKGVGRSDVDIVKCLLVLQRKCVKSIYSVDGKYFDQFDLLNCLPCLRIGKVLPGDYMKFIDLMLRNKSTLHTLCIEDGLLTHPLVYYIPLKSLKYLTSLSLSCIKLRHERMQSLVAFLSDNTRLEYLNLFKVHCYNHQKKYGDCTSTLHLSSHDKLISLSLECVDIFCPDVNMLNMRSITIWPYSSRIVVSNIQMFYWFRYSGIEHLDFIGFYYLDKIAMKTVAFTVQTLPSIKSLRLQSLVFPDHVMLKLHPDVTGVNIELYDVTMPPKCFQSFINDLVKGKSVIKMKLTKCKITESWSVLSVQESMNQLADFVGRLPKIIITYNDDARLYFETALHHKIKTCE